MKAASTARTRIGLAIILVLGIAAVIVSILAIADVSPRDIGDTFHATPADGSWKAVTFDGQSAKSKNYSVAIRRGRVVGGYDDCNGWSYQDEKPDRNGERMMLSTLVECPGDEDLRRLYRIVVFAPTIEIVSANELRLSRDGHQGEFRRCKPNKETRRCVEVP
jgi:hypothetical protein